MCYTRIGMTPYDKLYVYEISGVISDSRAFFKRDFLGSWTEGEISFLFFHSPNDREVEGFAKERGFKVCSKNVLDYREWQAGDELKPFRVGTLLFSPPWNRPPITGGETLVLIDPCVVFGSGSHPTTQACLEALSLIYEREKPEKVLDLGTGSGILAIAAAKLGAKKVVAVDSNELAVETAQRNVELNGESHRIDVRHGLAEEYVEEDAGLLCANLHLQVIETLLGKEAFFRKRWLILSGIFLRDADELEKRLRRGGVETIKRIEKKVWATFLGLNKCCQ